jgi:hypothetical protein
MHTFGARAAFGELFGEAIGGSLAWRFLSQFLKDFVLRRGWVHRGGTEDTEGIWERSGVVVVGVPKIGCCAGCFCVFSQRSQRF